MRSYLIPLMFACAGVAGAGVNLRPPSPIDDARLHDLSIEIRSSVCHDWGGCKEYTISIDRNGRGLFKLLADGEPKVRGFVRDRYVFRQVQITLEPLRPVQTNSTLPCKKCGPDYEATTVIWMSDRGTRQTADFKRMPHRLRGEIDGPLVTAQNLLLSTLAPHIQQP